MTNPVILTFVAHYLPGYKSGGPVRTIANMVAHLGINLDFHIITADRDSFEDHPYSNIMVNKWNQAGLAKVFYASPDFLRFRNIVKLICDTPHDVLYLNSFFTPKFTIMPLLARRLWLIPHRPVVLAPRGEFAKDALGLEAWKKRPYLTIARWLSLYRDLTWQASSENEAADIRRVFGHTASDIRVAIDLSPKILQKSSDFMLDSVACDGSLRTIFLARVSPMKNLDFALRVLAKVRIPLVFNIYGLVDDEPYWQQCQEQIKVLPSHIKVQYHSVIEHQKVADILANHDLFFLPTRGENYGHAIRESLAAGTPALISDRTPWCDLDEKGVGWVRNLEDIDAFVEIIESFVGQPSNVRQQQRAMAQAYARNVASDTVTVKNNLDLFMGAMEKAGCV